MTFQMIFENQYLQLQSIFFFYHVKTQLWFFLIIDAYFWTGNSSRPNPVGIIIPYPADYQGK